MADGRIHPHIDGHVHVFNIEQARNFAGLMDSTNATRIGLACQSDRAETNDNPAGFYLKACDPERFYLLAGLDHSGVLFHRSDAPSLEEQARFLRETGADGIKVLAGKPNLRKKLNTPLDGDYFRDFFTTCEELDIPLLWHVADPEEFWDPSKLPGWAQEQGWGYDVSFPSKETIYSEVESVLSRHRSLRVVFAHFYFLSADLPRAERFLNDFPNAAVDLAPGIELYYNLSRNREQARDFFIRFQRRILFGTDIMSPMTEAQVCARAGIVYRFLTGNDTFTVPEEADFLLGRADDGAIRGLDLPRDAAGCIMEKNFLRIYGKPPAKLNRELAMDECRRMARAEATIKSCPEDATEGGKALAAL